MIDVEYESFFELTKDTHTLPSQAGYGVFILSTL